jgi:hypothetical protein
MCLFNQKYHYINPSSQFALFSLCFDNCLSIKKIQWNIYKGSNKTDQWTLFSPMEDYFLGLNTKNLTVMKDLFAANKEIIYWRFQVIYSFGSDISQTEFDIKINEGPKNGFCSIDPLNGTMITLFTINCSNWYDQDQIKDFTFYAGLYFFFFENIKNYFLIKVGLKILRVE